MSERQSHSAELRVRTLTKRFGLRTIFSDLNFSLETGDVLAITGSNGSGKSTLLKILANTAERSGGTIEWMINGTALNDEKLPLHLGFVSPYLQLYTEFTALEHGRLMQDMRGLPFNEEYCRELLDRFGLGDRGDDYLSTFSSGMLQRVKYTCALLHNPTFLFLDEPMTNFDSKGIETVRELITENAANRITIIATNDPDDLKLCTKALSVERTPISIS